MNWLMGFEQKIFLLKLENPWIAHVIWNVFSDVNGKKKYTFVQTPSGEPVDHLLKKINNRVYLFIFLL